MMTRSLRNDISIIQKKQFLIKDMKKSQQTHYEWLFYAMSFLGLAKIGCKELIDQKYKEKDSLTENYLLYGNEESNSRSLLIPIFFNVKHALELFIKGMGVNIDRNYLHTHDLNNLLGDLESRVKELFKSKKNDKVFQKIEELKPIIEKYTGLEDYKNILYRYPNSKIDNLHTTRVEEILSDIEKIHKLFFLIKGIVNSARLGLPDPCSWS